MKIAIYPGSFNPWHIGHVDILNKALNVFDKIIVARGKNPEKEVGSCLLELKKLIDNKRVDVIQFGGLLVDEVRNRKVDAVIRGLRNGHDLQYEMNQQYWNEDLGLIVPVVYFICDRKLSHISSSMLRALDKING